MDQAPVAVAPDADREVSETSPLAHGLSRLASEAVGSILVSQARGVRARADTSGARNALR